MTSHRHDTTRTLQRRIAPPQRDEKPYLIGITGEHAGRLFPLADCEELAMGRTEDCEIRVTLDDMVSRRHARLEGIEGGGWAVEDLDSLNGTRVNGHDVKRLILNRGDWIDIGETTSFKFDYLSDQEKAQRESGLLDGLTEAWNRKAFDTRLPELFRQASERARKLSLLMLDVDHFKAINDEFGHQAGDHALRGVAAGIRDWLERTGVEAVFCRYGGEEFALILPRCGAEALGEHAEALRAHVAALVLDLGVRRHQITASLGGATLDAGNFAEPEQLVKAADDNLYAAKNGGRNKAVCG